MNYCVYFKESGELYSMTPIPVETEDKDYIEISPEDMEDFLNRRKSLIHYIVVPDYKIPHTGKLVKRSTLDQYWTKKEDTIYLIPTECKGDFVIAQNKIDKTCTVNINQVGKLMLSSKKITKIIVAACRIGNPFVPLWVWEISPNESSSITYSGTDDIRFYTTRILESYSHVNI